MATTVIETAAQPPADVAFKVAATDVEAPGTVEVREDEGLVTAIVSVTGIEDSVADIIEPGAYKETLTKRRPKVVWHHSWEDPIGRVLDIEELMPGDSRLPTHTKDGKPWPKAAGAVLATMQFNLRSTKGREAFEAVRFYSDTGECEWSIGYAVPEAAATKDKRGVRHIKKIDLFELSFVLFGAASETGTLGVKAALEAARQRKAVTGVDPGPAVTAPPAEAPTPEPGTEPGPGTPPGTAPVVPDTPPEVTPPNTEPVADPQPASDDVKRDDPEPDQAEPDGDDGDDPDDAEVQALIDATTDAEWDAAFAALDPADAELVKAFLDDVEGKAITPGGRVGDDSPIGEPGGRQNWVDKVGGLPRYIRMVAHALIRKGMDESRAIATAVSTMKRWAAGGGDVSAKVQAAAAKAVAEWEAKKAASRAKSAAPTRVSVWSPLAEVGQFASTKSVSPTSHRDFPRIEGTFEERIAAVRAAVVDALSDTYEPADGDDGSDGEADRGSWSHIEVDGTWPDRVIATCHKWDHNGGPGKSESYEMNYAMADDGEVTLSEPEPVTLTVYAEPVDGETADPEVPVGDLLPVPEMVEDAVHAAKALLHARQEVKAGRVLSGVNEARLKGALESLIAVLRAAGIEIDTANPARPAAAVDRDTGSTAPAAEVKTVSADEVRSIHTSLRT